MGIDSHGLLLVTLEISYSTTMIVSSNFASADFRKIKTYNFQKS